MTKTNIENCPFCGGGCAGKVYAVKQFLYAEVGCDACDVRVKAPVKQTDGTNLYSDRYTFDAVEDAMNTVIEKWNRRNDNVAD